MGKKHHCKNDNLFGDNGLIILLLLIIVIFGGLAMDDFGF